MSNKGREDVLEAYVYGIDADVIFLVGRATIKSWGSILNTRRNVLETDIDSLQKDCKMIETKTGHYGVVLETKGENGVMYLEEKEEDLTSFGAIKKVHEVNNHKGVEQLISVYSRAR